MWFLFRLAVALVRVLVRSRSDGFWQISVLWGFKIHPF